MGDDLDRPEIFNGRVRDRIKALESRVKILEDTVKRLQGESAE